jgi:hypothetical protein
MGGEGRLYAIMVYGPYWHYDRRLVGSVSVNEPGLEGSVDVTRGPTGRCVILGRSRTHEWAGSEDCRSLPICSRNAESAGLNPTFCSHVAKLVMWRWSEQPPVPSNRTMVERHISYRVPVPDGSVPSSPPASTEWPLAWRSTHGSAEEVARI